MRLTVPRFSALLYLKKTLCIPNDIYVCEKAKISLENVFSNILILLKEL